MQSIVCARVFAGQPHKEARGRDKGVTAHPGITPFIRVWDAQLQWCSIDNFFPSGSLL